MKKRIIIPFVVLLLIAISLFTLTSCKKAEYTLSSSRLSGFVEVGGEPNLSELVIIRTEGSKVTEIPVDMSMVYGLDTSTAGNKTFTVVFAENTFQVQYVVKYKVDFTVGGKVIDTQYVFDTSELEIPTKVEPKPGYEFEGFNIPSSLKENISCEAVYSPKAAELMTVKASYGDKLGDLTLPTNASGKWEFVDSADTLVGEVGTRKFEVKFVLNDGTILETNTVKVDVGKKKLEFKNLVTEFVYDGQLHFPTYELDANVSVYPSPKYETEAGMYNLMLIIDDDNYEGEYIGSFVIKKLPITVNVNSYTIKYGEAIPTVEYTVEGLTNPAIDLGIVLDDTSGIVGRVGTYTVGAKVTNLNIDAKINAGTITIEAIEYDPGLPVLVGGTRVYGDKLSTIGFEPHGAGAWHWVNPDDLLGDVGTNKHTAVFRPSSSNFAPKYVEIDVEVGKKTLDFNVSENVFTYDGTAKKLVFTVVDENGIVYDDIQEIIGNAECINAGVYSITLSVNDERYSGSRDIKLTINKAVPNTDFASAAVTAIWREGLTLGDISLGGGYSWLAPSTALSSATMDGEYAAVFTPDDVDNYESVEGKVSLTLEKADGAITGVNGEYTAVYNGSAYVISGITTNHIESSLVFEYKMGEDDVAEIVNAGTYTVKIILPATDNYNEASVSTSVVINKKENTDLITQTQKATYGDLISSALTLPESENGTWSWREENSAGNATVGNAGTHTFHAVFTPGNGNYAEREAEVTVTVEKKSVSIPTASNKDYNGQWQNSGLADTELYTVADEGGIRASSEDYKAVLTLRDSDNYTWHGTTEPSVTLTYRIRQSANSWITSPKLETEGGEIVYGEEYTATAEIKYGSFTLVFTRLDGTVIDRPSAAGDYYAVFTPTDESCNNNAAITERIKFTIAKKVVEIPEISKTEFTYNGLIADIGLTDTELYTVQNNGTAAAKVHDVILTLKDSANYTWQGTAAPTVQLTYEIKAGTASLDELQINGWTYGAYNAGINTPTVKNNTSFGTVVFKYSGSKDGAYTTEVPVNAGKWYVIAEIADDSFGNYTGTVTEPVEFEIEKATAVITVTNESIDKIFSASVIRVEGVSLNHSESVLVYTYKLGDAEKTSIYDAGNYTVTVTAAESMNYKAASAVLYVNVAPAENNEAVNTSQSATYGDLMSDKLTLPSGIGGTWSWLEDKLGTETVGTAGTKEFTAVFTPSDGNYVSREVKVTVTVAKREVSIPDAPTGLLYTGGTVTSGLTNTELYTVSDEGGIKVGNYSAVLTLKYPANYKWAGKDDAYGSSHTVIYTINKSANSWQTAPSINNIDFGGTLIPSASPVFGGYTVEYRLVTESADRYTAVKPTAVGKYVAIFKSTETENCTNVLSVELPFEITKKVINTPAFTKDTFVYGEEIKLGFAENTELYTYVINCDGNVGDTHSVTFTLIHPESYSWYESAAKTSSRTFEITKGAAMLGDDLVLEGWVYNTAGNHNTPTVSNNSGFASAVKFLYADNKNGTYTETVPTNAGTWYVKAIIETTSNFDGDSTDSVGFTITPADASIVIDDNIKYSFDFAEGNVYDVKSLIGTSYGDKSLLTVKITKDGIEVSEILDAGTYHITATLAEGNYKGDSKEFDITVNKIYAPASSDFTAFVFKPTYGDKLDNSVLPASPYGVWAWENAGSDVGNAGDASYKAVFTPDSVNGRNYLATEYTVITEVARKEISAPAIPEILLPYNKHAQASGITSGTGYSVLDNGGIDAGTYTAYLVIDANHAWTDGTATDAEGRVVFTYKITPVDNSVSFTSSNGEYGKTEFTYTVTPEYDGSTVTVKYYVNGSLTAERPTDAGTYKLYITVTNKNCNDLILDGVHSVTIERQRTARPELTVNEFTFGDDIKLDYVKNDDAYTTSDQAITVYGEHSITFKLNVNYMWDDGDVTDHVLTYKVNTAANEITLTVSGWTFGGTKLTPTVSAKFGKENAVIYYDTSADGSFTSTTAPTNAGTYYVRAYIPADGNNYTEITSGTETLVIAKAIPEITGIKNTYTSVYNGSEYVITGLGANYTDGSSASFTFTDEDGNNITVKDFGDYTVYVSLLETANYEKVTKKVTVSILAAADGDTIPTSVTAKYGTEISALPLPSNVNGKWTWKESGTVGSAGTVRTITAVFTPNTANYAAREVEVTLTVKQAVITVPVISDKQYTGNVLLLGLASDSRYTVEKTEPAVVKDPGEYTVTLKITDSNYAWDENGTNITTATFKVSNTANSWNVTPSVPSIDFGGTLTPSAEAAIGGYGITYYYNKDGVRGDKVTDLKDGMPYNAGKYIAAFVTTDEISAKAEADVPFEIKAKKLDMPTLSGTSFVYGTDFEISVNGIPEGVDVQISDYTFNLKNADKYTVTVTLINSSANNYGFTDALSTSVDLVYEITKADTSLGEVSINGWTYGKYDAEANKVTAVNPNTFSVDITYEYYAVSGGSTVTYTREQLKDLGAGTYYVKAVINGTSNYNGCESAPKEFTVSKAPASIIGIKDSYTKTYDGKPIDLGTLSASWGKGTIEITFKKDGTAISAPTNAGEYTVTVKLLATDNFEEKLYEDIPVIIEKVKNTENVVTEQEVFYLDTVAELTLPAGINGTWSWQGKLSSDKVEDANATYEYTAVFTPSDAENYEGRNVTVYVTVKQYLLPTPIVQDKDYNGKEQTSGMISTGYYMVTSDEPHKDVGDNYSVTFEITNDNFRWADTESKSITVYYSIKSVENEWTAAPEIKPTEGKSEIVFGDGYTVGAELLHGGYRVEYYEGSTLLDGAPTAAGSYTAVFTPIDGNCNNNTEVTTSVGFTIEKKVIEIPTNGILNFTYGDEINTNLSDTDDYTVKVNDLPTPTVGEHDVILTLKDDKNHIWSDGSLTAVTLKYSVEKAEAAFDDAKPAISGWIFGSAANVPTIGYSKTFGTVEFLYSSTIDGEYSKTVPVNAGTYYVKAVVAEDAINYSGCESGVSEFVIAPKTVTVTAADSYSHTYNGKSYVIEGLAALEGKGAYTFTIYLVETVDGIRTETLVLEIKNAGEYRVEISATESTGNYAYTTFTATVNVAKAEYKPVITVPAVEYGTQLKDIALPTDTHGTFAWADGEEYVGDVATSPHEYDVIFTSSDANYKDGKITVKVTVTAKVIDIPVIPQRSYEDGKSFDSGLKDNAYYTVKENNAPLTGVGTGSVTLTLKANYAFKNSSLTSVTVYYTIAEAGGNTIDSITVRPNWTYGDVIEGSPVTATASHDGSTFIYEFKKEDESDDAYTTNIPTEAGNYVVRVTAKCTNYSDVSDIQYFTIAKKAVGCPELSDDSFVYKDAVSYVVFGIASEMIEDTHYTKYDDREGIDVGTYTVTFELTDPDNYTWTDGTNAIADAKVERKYVITTAANSIKDLAINGWTYGDDANSPTASSDFGTIVYTYSSEKDGTYTSTVPTDAGTYYVKAYVAADSKGNYTSAEDVVSFVIAQKAITITSSGLPADNKFTFDGSDIGIMSYITTSLGSTECITVTVNGGTNLAIVNAGAYAVKAVVSDGNYTAADLTFTVTIEARAAYTDDDFKDMTFEAVYGDSLSSVALPTAYDRNGEVIGTWAWQSTGTVGDKGTNAHVAVFTPASTNYKTTTHTVSIAVEAYTVNLPAVSAPTLTYNGSKQYYGLTSGIGYYAVDDGNVNKGENYKAYLVLTSENYQWPDGTVTDEYGRIEYTYSIGAGKNEFTRVDITSGKVYGDGKTITVSVTTKHGGTETVQFFDANGNSVATPTEAGTYKIVITVKNDNCDDLVSADGAYSVTIDRMSIEKPEVSADFTYTGKEQKPTVAESEYYTSVIVGATNVGETGSVTFKLAGTNYKWADNTTADHIVTFGIKKAQAVISDFTIQSWTYGSYDAEVNSPSATTSFGEITYTYYKNGQKLDGMPSTYGTYTVEASVEGTDNYDGTSEEISFTISRADVTFSGIPEGGFTHEYNGKPYTVSGITSSSDASIVYTYSYNTSEVLGVGEYTVTVSVAATDKYNAASETIVIKVTVGQLTGVEGGNLTTSYDVNKTLASLTPTGTKPAGIEGTWTWDYPSTLLGNASTTAYEFAATFTPADTNYALVNTTVKVTVTKKTITAPNVTASGLVYNGKPQSSGIIEGEGYTVSGDNQTNAGTHTVTLKLASTNYQWSGTTSDTITRTYVIAKATNSWTTAPTVTDGVYEKTSATASATPAAGSVVISYYDADGKPVSAPALAGTYTVKFTVKDSNYETLTAEKTVTIAKQKVTAPDAGSKTYTGETLVSDVQGNTIYTVKTNNGGVDVGKYSVEFELIDKNNYEWDGQNTSAFEITKGTLSPTITLSGWTYTDTQPGSATVVFNFSETVNKIKYTVEYDINGEHLAAIPEGLGAGSYQVVLTVTGTSNYDGGKFYHSFTVEKKQLTSADIGLDTGGYTADYTGGAYNVTLNIPDEISSAVTEAYAGTYITADGKAVDAGSYTYTVEISETANYKAFTATTVNITINKIAFTAEIPDSILNQTAVYGDTLADLAKPDAPSDANGGWAWTLSDGVSVGNATAEGETRAFEIKFTSRNYLDRQATVNVTVEKFKVYVPEISGITYNGEEQSAEDILKGNEYAHLFEIVTVQSGTNAGAYTAELQLKDSDNYEWIKTSAREGLQARQRDRMRAPTVSVSVINGANVVITYYIDRAENSWKITPALNSAYIYEAYVAFLGGMPEAQYDGIVMSATRNGEAFSITLEQLLSGEKLTAGEYEFTIATAADENGVQNGTDLSVTIKVIVSKKVVNTPVMSVTGPFTYTGNEADFTVSGSDIYYSPMNESIVKGTDAGDYTLVFTLTDPDNYAWDDKDNTSATTEVKYSIEQYKTDLSGIEVSLGDIVYGQTDALPTPSYTGTVVFGTLEYEICELKNGSYDPITLTNTLDPAGDYYIRGYITATKNWTADETAYVPFDVDKAQGTILGMELINTSFAYTGSAYDLPAITAGNGSTGTVTVKVNGSLSYEIKNVGTYNIAVTLAETDTHYGTEAAAAIVITKADYPVTLPTVPDRIYSIGATLGGIALEVQNGDKGTWAWDDYYAEIGNAGNKSFAAIFTPEDTSNYNITTHDIEFTVLPMGVDVPAIGSAVYTGEAISASVSYNLMYEIKTPVSGISAGDYDVVLTLKDTVNYYWNVGEGTTADQTVKFTITPAADNAWTQYPTIANTTVTYSFGAQVITYTAQSVYGDVVVYYAARGTDSFEVGLPAEPGEYTVRFTTDGINANKLADVDIYVKIEKIGVTTPVLENSIFTYTGTAPAFSYTASELYTLKSDTGAAAEYAANADGTNYVLTFELTEEASRYYMWTENTAGSTVSVSYTVSKAVIDLDDVTVSYPDIVYGQAELPSASYTGTLPIVGAELEYKFYKLEGGEYVEITLSSTTDLTPADGLYYVRGYLANTGNYNEAYTAYAPFKVSKADAVIDGIDDISTTIIYTGEAYTLPAFTVNGSTDGVSQPVIGNANGYTEIKLVGTYTVTVTYSGSDCYNAVTKTVTVNVTPASIGDNITVNDIHRPYAPGLTLGSVIGELPASVNGFAGIWAWALDGTTALGNASDTADVYEATFTPTDKNYAAVTVSVNVYVDYIKIARPELTASTVLYAEDADGNPVVHIPVRTGEGYTVSPETVSAVGTYTVTVTLDANYAWADGQRDVIEYQFRVSGGENSWITTPALNGNVFDYSPAGTGVAVSVSGAAQYDDDGVIDISYRLKDSAGGFTSGLPSEPGTYTVRFTAVSVNVDEDLTYDVEVTINRIKLTVPTLTQTEYVYNGNTAPAFKYTASDKYTITSDTGSAAGYIVTQSGSQYTLTFKLTDDAKKYYMWNDGTDGAKTANYTIGKATITFTDFKMSSTSWYYGQTEGTPSATVNFGTVYFKYATSAGGTYVTYAELLGSNTRLNAATYYVKAFVDGSDNWYENSTTTPISFTVAKATPKLVNNLDGDKAPYKYYENQFNIYDYVWFVNPYTNETVAGVSALSNGYGAGSNTHTIERISTSYAVSIIETANHTSVAAENVPVYFKTVATIGFQGLNKYGTIEKALAAATSGQTVWVIPDTTGKVIIVKDAEIKSGVTLMLPYGAAETDINSSGEASVSSTGATKDSDCKSIVTIGAGKTLTVNGTLQISGVLSGGNGGGEYAGHTYGSYAVIQMSMDSEIFIDKGTVKAYGFIKELSDSQGYDSAVGNGSKVTVSASGTLYEPFVLLDFRGGSVLYAINDEMKEKGYSPFSEFTFMNVTSKLVIHQGGVLKAYCNLYAGSQQNFTESLMVGEQGDTCLLQLSNGARLEAKYDPETKITALDIYGGASLNQMTLNLSIIGEDSLGGLGGALGGLIGGDLELNSKDFVFGLSWLYHISLNSGDYTMNDSYKMLPGSILRVESDATLIVNSLAVYDTFPTTSLPQPYPTDKAPAQLIVNGMLTATSLGGKVYTEVDNARVMVSSSASVSVNEALSTTGEKTSTKVADTTTVTCTLAFYYIGADGTIGQYTKETVEAGYMYISGGTDYWLKTAKCPNCNADEIHYTCKYCGRYDGCPSGTPNSSDHAYCGECAGCGEHFTEAWHENHATCEHCGDYVCVNADNHTTLCPYGCGKYLCQDTMTHIICPCDTCDEAVCLDPSKHLPCDTCGKQLCDTTVDHSTLPCGTKACAGGSHGICEGCGNCICNENFSHIICEACKGFMCNGEDHTMYDCGNHYACQGDAASNHVLKSCGHHYVCETDTLTHATWSCGSHWQCWDDDTEGKHTNTHACGSHYQCVDNSSGNHTTKCTCGKNYLCAGKSGHTSSTSDCCITPDTLITLADGSQVMVKNLTGDEMLLVWNLFTGEFDVAPILFIDYDAESCYEIIYLTFSDGTVVKVISEHGFFDYDLNKYVYLDRDAAEYIGHSFDKSGERVQLVNVELKTELTTAWSPVTYGHLCYYVNGMLSMPGGITGLFNIFEIDPETMKYDEAKMQADIEKYGLFTYEEFAALVPVPETAFDALGGKYLKVAIGKGMITIEELQVLAERYGEFFV